MVFYHFFNQPQVWGPVKMFPKVFRETSNFIHSAKRKKVIPSFPNLNPTSTLGKFGYHTSRRLFCTERGKHLISYLIKHTLIFRCMLNGKFLRANCHPHNGVRSVKKPAAMYSAIRCLIWAVMVFQALQLISLYIHIFKNIEVWLSKVD